MAEEQPDLPHYLSSAEAEVIRPCNLHDQQLSSFIKHLETTFTLAVGSEPGPVQSHQSARRARHPHASKWVVTMATRHLATGAGWCCRAVRSMTWQVWQTWITNYRPKGPFEKKCYFLGLITMHYNFLSLIFLYYWDKTCQLLFKDVLTLPVLLRLN